MDVIISIFLKTISIVMLIVFILSIVLLIITFHRPKKVSIPSIAITIIISLITLVVFSSLAHYEPPAWLWLILVSLGIALGVVWSKTTRVFTKDAKVMSQNSILYLVVWGSVFAINQLITIATNKPPDVAMALLIISTGTVWGTNGAIINKYFKVKAELQSAAVVTERLPISNGVHHAQEPGPPSIQPSQTAAVPASAIQEIDKPISQPQKEGVPIPAGFCPTCGALVKEGSAFCMKCGGRL